MSRQDYGLWLQMPYAGLHTFMLILWDRDQSKLDRFVEICNQLPRDLMWFHQIMRNSSIGETEGFEFFTSNQDAILDACTKVAAEMGMELELRDC